MTNRCSPETKVSLDVALSKDSPNEADVVEATARVTNLTDTQLLTVVAIVGVPGGLEPRRSFVQQTPLLPCLGVRSRS